MWGLTSGLRILMDTLSGYLLVVVFTSSLPIIRNKLSEDLPSQVKKPFLVHPTLPDLQDFYMVECLVLYLVLYPALIAYRSIPSGSILGYTSLTIGLIVVLGYGIGPVMKKQQHELEEKRQALDALQEKNPKENNNRTREMFKRDTPETTNNSSLTADTNVPNLQAEENTPTTANKYGDNFDFNPPNEPSPTKPRNIKRHSVSNVTEDEDALSVVTWDAPCPETQGQAQKPSGHRRVHTSANTFPVAATGQGLRNEDGSLSKELDGNLIDSNLEPHYSNLIDSANAVSLFTFHLPKRTDPTYTNDTYLHSIQLAHLRR